MLEPKKVIPLCPEPILKQDDQSKNDAEYNAAKRLIKKFREDQSLSFILGAKPGHVYFF